MDTALFGLIAITMKNGFFDFVMPAVSNAKLWVAPLALLVAAMLVFGKEKGARALLICIIAVGLSDFTCGSILQPLINRPRPLGGVTPSFPSCHAANIFAAATVMALVWKNKVITAISFAAAILVGYSRIYTTSHYPSDVAAGAVIGCCFAYAGKYAYEYAAKRIKQKALKSRI